jgi:hypothetical protein
MGFQYSRIWGNSQHLGSHIFSVTLSLAGLRVEAREKGMAAMTHVYELIDDPKVKVRNHVTMICFASQMART